MSTDQIRPYIDRVTYTSASIRVSAAVNSIPDVDRDRDGGIVITPSRATLNYTLRDGFWRCHVVRATGYRVLKPGKDGERRVSDKSEHTAEWHAYGSEDLAREGASRMWGEMPAALRQVVEDMRPVGLVTLPTESA